MTSPPTCNPTTRLTCADGRLAAPRAILQTQPPVQTGHLEVGVTLVLGNRAIVAGVEGQRDLARGHRIGGATVDVHAGGRQAGPGTRVAARAERISHHLAADRGTIVSEAIALGWIYICYGGALYHLYLLLVASLRNVRERGVLYRDVRHEKRKTADQP